MKFIREVQNNEFIITSKEGKQVRIKATRYNNLGSDVSLYGNKNSEFRESMQPTFWGRNFKTWPRVGKIEYDEESDNLLFQDYIEIYDEYNDVDEPFITEIYFYVDFDGNIITDAYVPMMNKYYPLDVEREIPRCSWLEGNLSSNEKFCRRYVEIKEEIGWKIIFLLERRKNKMRQKLLNRKQN